MNSNEKKDAIIARFVKSWQFENFPPTLKKLIEKEKNIDKLRIEEDYPIGVYRKVAKHKGFIYEFFSSFFVMSYSAEELKKLRANHIHNYRPHLYSKNKLSHP